MSATGHLRRYPFTYPKAIGKLRNDDGMVTLHRERGFDVVLYPGDKEHSPPHVHVFYGEEEAKIALGDEDTAPWVWQVLGMRKPNVARALEIVEENQESFLAHWRKYHGA